MPTTDIPVTREGLRPIAKAEEGTSFTHLPAGVFGFTYAPLTESPLFSKHDYHCFEMQKHPDGAGSLVCWVTPEEASQIAASQAFLDLYVYPEKWKEAIEAVSISVDRLNRRNRNPIREDGNRLAVTVAPAK